MPGHDADDLTLIEEAARKGGEIARSYFGGEYRRWSKNRGEPVTEADLAIDRLLNDVLLDARPGYGWLSEESDRSPEPRSRTFIVDPIDGTAAFLKAKPYFSISIAVVEDGEPRAGVVFNPITDECFSASRGAGSRLNGQPVRVSNQDTILNCRMLGAKDLFEHSGWSVSPNTPWPEMHIETRNSIAYRMALVAAGAFDAALVLSAKHDWDIAAGDLIVREAGGLVTAHDGSTFRYGNYPPIQRSMVCAGPALHARILEKLRPVHLPER